MKANNGNKRFGLICRKSLISSDPLSLKIHHFLRRIRFRMVLQKQMELLVLLMGIGAGIGLLVNLVALFHPIYNASLFGWIVLAAMAVLALVYPICRWPSERQAAALVDQAGLKERVSTSIEHDGDSGEWISLLRQDTVDQIECFDCQEELPLTWKWKRIAGFFLFFLCFFLCSLVQSDSKNEAIRLHELKGQVQQEEASVQKAEKALEKALEEKTISKKNAERLKKLLEQVKEQYKQADELKDVNEAKKQLEKKLTQQLAKESDAKLLQQFQPLTPNKNLIAESKYQKDLQELAEQSDLIKQIQTELESLLLSDEKKEELIQSLNEAMEDGQLTQRELNQSLENLQDAEAVIAQKAISNQLAVSEEAQKQEQSGDADGEAAMSMKGQSDEQSSEAKATGKTTDDSGDGMEPGAGTQKAAMNSTSKGGNNSSAGYYQGSNEGKETMAQSGQEKVTISEGEIGDDENLTADKQKGTSQMKKSKSDNAWSGQKQNYHSVVGEYSKRAYAQIQKSKMPSQMKSMIKEYFSGLE